MIHVGVAALDEARACEGSANQGGTTVDLYPFVPGLWPGAKGFLFSGQESAS
jgi:hypothetical protein